VAISLARLPRFLVLDPVSTVRIEMKLDYPSCEIDVELQNPRPGRSFVLLLGKRGGPYLQRMRLSGRARIRFRPKAAGEYLLMLANPNREPLILRLRGRNIRGRRTVRARFGGHATGAAERRPLRAERARRKGASSPVLRHRSDRAEVGPASLTETLPARLNRTRAKN
jgi:hypothetical protein